VFFAAIAFVGLSASMWRFAYAVSDGPDARRRRRAGLSSTGSAPASCPAS
jgi:hypothetical protein